jgi:hypothetical protein
MNRKTDKPAPKTPEVILAGQKLNFTAEGAPPPGKISTSPPELPQADPASRPPPMRGRRRTPRTRKP